MQEPPALMFTDEEALAVTLGLTSATPAVEGALAKIERVLPQILQERVRAVQDTLSLAFPAINEPPSSDILLTLCLAAQREQRVHIGY